MIHDVDYSRLFSLIDSVRYSDNDPTYFSCYQAWGQLVDHALTHRHLELYLDTESEVLLVGMPARQSPAGPLPLNVTRLVAKTRATGTLA